MRLQTSDWTRPRIARGLLIEYCGDRAAPGRSADWTRPPGAPSTRRLTASLELNYIESRTASQGGPSTRSGRMSGPSPVNPTTITSPDGAASLAPFSLPLPQSPVQQGPGEAGAPDRLTLAANEPAPPPSQLVCANLTVETGHFPSWPLMEIRRPCISSSQTVSTVPAFPSVRITALPTSSVWARPNSLRIVAAWSFAVGKRDPESEG